MKPGRSVQDLSLIHISMVEKMTSAAFETEVLKAEMPVLVDFYADWCGPCKMMAPAVESAAEAYSGKVKVFKLNVDENGDVAERYAVMSIPTLILFKNGQEVKRMVGLQSKGALNALIDSDVYKRQEHQSCHSIGVEPGFFRIVGTNAVDDI